MTQAGWQPIDTAPGGSADALGDRKVFADATGIIPMGGGYDWRCFVDRCSGPWFLCKDGLPLRDSSELNTDGWRVCVVEIGREQAITKFAEYVHGLQRRLEDSQQTQAPD